MEGANNYDPKAELDKIVKACLESNGFVIFVSVRSGKNDEKGEEILNHTYSRYHYGIEDLIRQSMPFAAEKCVGELQDLQAQVKKMSEPFLVIK